jgi:hypothetical protein
MATPRAHLAAARTRLSRAPRLDHRCHKQRDSQSECASERSADNSAYGLDTKKLPPPRGVNAPKNMARCDRPAQTDLGHARVCSPQPNST